MPLYMKHMGRSTLSSKNGDEALEELLAYQRLSQSLKALIIGAEPLMKPLPTQHRLLEGVTSLSGHKKDPEESTVINPRLGLQYNSQTSSFHQSQVRVTGVTKEYSNSLV